MTRPSTTIRPRAAANRRTIPMRVAVLLGLIPLLSSCGDGPVQQVDPATAIQRGWELFRRAEFAPAASSFESALAASARKDGTHIEALYGLGIVSRLRRPDEDLEKASASFREVIALAPESDLAAWSALELAEDCSDSGEHCSALLDVFRRYPETLAGQQAFIACQSQRLAPPGNTQECIGQLEEFIRRFPRSTLQFAAWNLMADAHETSGNARECVRARIRAVEAAESPATSVSFDRATAFWGIAFMAEYQLGDFETARKYYGRLVNELAGDARIGWAKIELRRMDEADAGLATPEVAAGHSKRSGP